MEKTKQELQQELQQEFKQDAIESRQHSEKLFWDELRPKLWNVLGMALLITTVAVAASSGWWALLPLAGSIFSFYEAKVTTNQYQISAINTEADVRSNKESMNLWEAQQKVQQKATEKETAAASSIQDHSGHHHGDAAAPPSTAADAVASAESYKKPPIKPLAERQMDAAASSGRSF